MVFRGGAGTGKSFTLRAVHDALKDHGRTVEVLAPQCQQVAGLAEDGMAGAQTVSAFLTRKRMVEGAVVIVDEAGQIGAKDMLALLTFVQRHRGRVILSGDTRQHGAVQASDALWAIEKYARLPVITEDKGRFVFPYFQFVRGHLEDTEDGKELLTLRFPSDTVEIRGKRLEPLEKALEDLSLAWVRVLPSRYAPLAPEGSPVVMEIVVCPTTETSTAEA